MKNTVQLVVALVVALALGCGGSSETHESEATSGAETGHEHHAGMHEHHEETHERHEEHHAQLPPAVHAFHDGVAHHWHGDRSSSAVCPDAVNLQALAVAAADEQQAHAAAADETRAAAQALTDVCANEGHPGFDAAFERLHDALHALMEAQH